MLNRMFPGAMGFGSMGPQPMAFRAGPKIMGGGAMAGMPYDQPMSRQRPAAPAAQGPAPWIDAGGGETNNSDPRGGGRDQRSYGSFTEMIGHPDFRGDWGKLAAMASPMMSFGRNMITGSDPIQGGNLSDGGVNAADLGASLAEGNTTGMFANGGVVGPEDMRGPNPPGPDQGFVGVHEGEMILNRPQQLALMRALMGR